MITTENYTGFDLRCVEVAMQLHKTKPAGEAPACSRFFLQGRLTGALSWPFPACPLGDILIFLTGRGEIEKVVNELYKQSEDLHYESEVRQSAE